MLLLALLILLGAYGPFASAASTGYHPSLAGGDIFPSSPNTLAVFEFNGNVVDSSGNARNATLLGGSFVSTLCGQALKVGGLQTNGLNWSTYAALLKHPYTVEIVLTPNNTTQWRKLFGFSDADDDGWYYKDEGIQAYPNPVLAPGQVKAGQLHYIAFVSTAPDKVNVYFQGVLLGSTAASFTAPPPQAIFFKDDTQIQGEDLQATVEAIRISSVSRTETEISSIQARILQCSAPRKTFIPLVTK
jgi:hypothetical protein